MAIYKVDFIFCCPCFVDDVSETGYFLYTKNYEFVHFIRKRHPKMFFDVDEFQDEKNMLPYDIHRSIKIQRLYF